MCMACAQVIFIHTGAAQGSTEDEQGHTKVNSLYIGRADELDMGSAGDMTRGSVIGGTALVDASLNGKPYPNTITLTRRTK